MPSFLSLFCTCAFQIPFLTKTILKKLAAGLSFKRSIRSFKRDLKYHDSWIGITPFIQTHRSNKNYLSSGWKISEEKLVWNFEKKIGNCFSIITMLYNAKLFSSKNLVYKTFTNNFRRFDFLLGKNTWRRIFFSIGNNVLEHFDVNDQKRREFVMLSLYVFGFVYFVKKIIHSKFYSQLLIHRHSRL